ncbi:hypothetical protein LINPERHAP2_LOCUS32325 [Linum perenne]
MYLKQVSGLLATQSQTWVFRDLLAKDWIVDICHVYREGNQAADYLASIGFNFPLGSHEIPISDCSLNYFARLDSLGVATVRMINNTS